MNLRCLALPLSLLLTIATSHAVDAEGVTEDRKNAHALKPAERKGDTTPADSAAAAQKGFRRAKIPAGFKADLWAAEPLLANPVAFSFDGKGRMFIAETHRYRTSVLDIRHYMFMLEDDLANRNQADWERSIKKNFPNDWQELGKETEVVRLVEDTDGDGKADKSGVYADGFNSILDGIASGVLARPDGVWVTNIPGLYKLSGQGADGKAEKKEEVFRGFGVRFSYTGHDLHGLIKGPDGRLYFSIGDRGASVKTKEGGTIEVPDEGAIFRCEEDGSHLELVMRGLRNPQELAFDDYGNLFTCDNDSDQGDRERLVYVVEGGDAGWRVGYQHCPQPAERNPWLAEHMWEPRDPAKNQPASILSPVANLPDGPGGLVHYPGTGLPEKYNGCFFLACYKGSSATSQVAVFKPVPDGAGFKLELLETFIPGCQATDVDFGPDSRMYVSFWDEGWERTAQGRIMKVEHEEARKAQAAQIAEVQRLLGEGMKSRSAEELVKLLGHKDQRVRLEAQWELERGMQLKGPRWRMLIKTLENKDRTVQRHALWALTNSLRRGLSAQFAAEYGKLPEDPAEADKERARRKLRAAMLPDYRELPDELAATLASLKVCEDSEMHAQVLRCLGDIIVTWGPSSECGQLIHDGLAHSSKQVRLFAAQALRRKSDAEHLVPALRRMTQDNHLPQELELAAAMSVAKMGWSGNMVRPTEGGVRQTVFEEWAEDSNPRVRMVALRAAVYALELPDEPKALPYDRERVLALIAAMLSDKDPAIAREALWLVSDRGLEAALSAAGHAVFDQIPEEASGLKPLRSADNGEEERQDELSVLRRFNAYFRTGGAVNAERLVSELNETAARPSPELCVEALKMLAEWEKPPVRDLVTGLFRPLAKRPGESAALALHGLSEELIESHAAVTLQMLETVRATKVAHWADYCAALVSREEFEPAIRVKALHVLSGLRGTAELAETLKGAASDPNSTVRIAAAGLLGKTDRAAAAKALESALAQGTAEDARAAFVELAALAGAAADRIVSEQLAALAAGKVPAIAKLELLEAAAKREAPAVKEALAKYEAALPQNDVVAKFAACLEGGDKEAGRKLYNEHPVAACKRCHIINHSGGEAGPALDGIGAKDRRYLLESIIAPNAQIAETFRMVVCNMKDGTVKTGVLRGETAESVTIQTPGEEPETIKTADIATRDAVPSGMMPGLEVLLTKRELRDLVEYLASLKTDPGSAPKSGK